MKKELQVDWLRRWSQAQRAEPEEFDGAYRVHMWPWFYNVKVIGGQHKEGRNIAYGFIKWGRFVVEVDKGDTCFRYTFWTFRDYVRRTRPGFYIGKFYVNDRQIGWFELEKVCEEGRCGEKR